ncbi:hypothetical protein D3C84_1036330 [compost metagenome]
MAKGRGAGIVAGATLDFVDGAVHRFELPGVDVAGSATGARDAGGVEPAVCALRALAYARGACRFVPVGQ